MAFARTKSIKKDGYPARERKEPTGRLKGEASPTFFGCYHLFTPELFSSGRALVSASIGLEMDLTLLTFSLIPTWFFRLVISWVWARMFEYLLGITCFI